MPGFTPAMLLFQYVRQSRQFIHVYFIYSTIYVNAPSRERLIPGGTNLDERDREAVELSVSPNDSLQRNDQCRVRTHRHPTKKRSASYPLYHFGIHITVNRNRKPAMTAM